MKWVEIGFKLVPLVIGAVSAVERLVSGLKGQAKQDAAVEFTKSVMTAVEGLAGKDLLDDEQVQKAVRNLIDAAVAVQNVVAAVRAAKPTLPPAA